MDTCLESTEEEAAAPASSPNASQHHRNVPGESAITTELRTTLSFP